MLNWSRCSDVPVSNSANVVFAASRRVGVSLTYSVCGGNGIARRRK